MNPKNYFRPCRTLKEKYKRLCSWYKPFHSPRFIHVLSFELFKWGHRKNAMSIEQFLQRYAIPPKLYYKWLGEYPELQNAHEFTVMGIGITREDLAMHWKVDASVVMKSQSYYSGVWRECEEFRAELRHGIELKSEQPQVYIELIQPIPEVTTQSEAHMATQKELGCNKTDISSILDSELEHHKISDVPKYSFDIGLLASMHTGSPTEYTIVRH